MRRALLALALLLATPAAQALTLLEIDANETTRVRVRADGGDLRARALAGEPTLPGADLDDRLQPLDAEGTTWRGFANVTTLTVGGSGWLLLADASGALAIPVPTGEETTDRRGDDESDERGRASGAEGPEHGDRGGEAAASGEPAPTRSAPRRPPNASSTPSPQEAGKPTDRSEAAREGADGWRVDPVAVGLTSLAVGAFAVERFQARSRKGGRR